MTHVTGKQLRRMRKDRGLSVEKAATLVHVTRRTWVRWEAEGGVPEMAAHLISLLWGLPYRAKKS